MDFFIRLIFKLSRYKYNKNCFIFKLKKDIFFEQKYSYLKSVSLKSIFTYWILSALEMDTTLTPEYYFLSILLQVCFI